MRPDVLPHPRSLSQREREDKPFSPRDKGTLEAEQKGWDEGAVSEWVAVCKLTDIVPDTGVCALVHGCQVAVFRLGDDRVYAIGNLDPFSKANVLSRGIVGDLKGELVVASPVYKQHFSLITGQCLEDADVRVAVFPARVADGAILVKNIQ